MLMISCGRLSQRGHTKEALQVCFPEHGSGGAEWLISSSADGFINVMDLKEGLDEEDAFRVRAFCICCRMIITGTLPDPKGLS